MLASKGAANIRSPLPAYQGNQPMISVRAKNKTIWYFRRMACTLFLLFGDRSLLAQWVSQYQKWVAKKGTDNVHGDGPLRHRGHAG
jgi:hypothetical protein